jgi:hypothetical protein
LILVAASDLGGKKILLRMADFGRSQNMLVMRIVRSELEQVI